MHLKPNNGLEMTSDREWKNVMGVPSIPSFVPILY